MSRLAAYRNRPVLAPWGYTDGPAPNRAALVALGNGMSEFNGYPVSTGDGGVGYFAPGATDDWMYGTRGVPAYTFEVGPLQRVVRWFHAGLLLPGLGVLAEEQGRLHPCREGRRQTLRRAALTPSGPKNFGRYARVGWVA